MKGKITNYSSHSAQDEFGASLLSLASILLFIFAWSAGTLSDLGQ